MYVSVKVGQSQWRRLRCLGMRTPLLLQAAKVVSSIIASRASRIFRRVCLIIAITPDMHIYCVMVSRSFLITSLPCFRGSPPLLQALLLLRLRSLSLREMRLLR